MNIFLLIPFLAFSTIFYGQDNKGKIEVVFTNQTTFNDLVKIKLDLSEQGVSITYNKLVFDENERLFEISLSVDCNDGFKGSASKRGLKKNKKFGFIRDYEKNKPFVIGDLE